MNPMIHCCDSDRLETLAPATQAQGSWNLIGLWVGVEFLLVSSATSSSDARTLKNVQCEIEFFLYLYSPISFFPFLIINAWNTFCYLILDSILFQKIHHKDIE